MKKLTKIALCCVLCVLLTALAACAAQGEKDPDSKGIEMYDTDEAEQTPAAQYGSNASVHVTGTKAYVLDGQLYGAAAYTNDGDCPVTVTAADFLFTWDGGERTESFLPACAQYDRLLPGETGYAVCWIEGVEGLPAAGVTLASAQIACEKTQEQPLPFGISDARLIHNYPKFATWSGRITNQSSETCTLCMVSVGFYGAGDEFLGAWYFTCQAKLKPDAGTYATSHLRAMPLIADDCVRMDCRAFGLL